MYSSLILLFSLFSLAFSNPLAGQECGRRSLVPGIRIVGGRNASEGKSSHGRFQYNFKLQMVLNMFVVIQFYLYLHVVTL